MAHGVHQYLDLSDDFTYSHESFKKEFKEKVGYEQKVELADVLFLTEARRERLVNDVTNQELYNHLLENNFAPHRSQLLELYECLDKSQLSNSLTSVKNIVQKWILKPQEEINPIWHSSFAYPDFWPVSSCSYNCSYQIIFSSLVLLFLICVTISTPLSPYHNAPVTVSNWTLDYITNNNWDINSNNFFCGLQSEILFFQRAPIKSYTEGSVTGQILVPDNYIAEGNMFYCLQTGDTDSLLWNVTYTYNSIVYQIPQVSTAELTPLPINNLTAGYTPIQFSAWISSNSSTLKFAVAQFTLTASPLEDTSKEVWNLFLIIFPCCYIVISFIVSIVAYCCVHSKIDANILAYQFSKEYLASWFVLILSPLPFVYFSIAYKSREQDMVLGYDFWEPFQFTLIHFASILTFRLFLHVNDKIEIPDATPTKKEDGIVLFVTDSSLCFFRFCQPLFRFIHFRSRGPYGRQKYHRQCCGEICGQIF